MQDCVPQFQTVGSSIPRPGASLAPIFDRSRDFGVRPSFAPHACLFSHHFLGKLFCRVRAARKDGAAVTMTQSSKVLAFILAQNLSKRMIVYRFCRSPMPLHHLAKRGNVIRRYDQCNKVAHRANLTCPADICNGQMQPLDEQHLVAISLGEQKIDFAVNSKPSNQVMVPVLGI